MRKIFNKTDNLDYFKTWSHNMAYILGFYTGDGCITKNGNCLVLAFRINSKDKYILEFIKQEINPNRNIQDYCFKQQSGYISNMSVLKITNQIICNDILNMGFKLRKTYNCVLPEIPEKYKPDYLRGYFDSDGCASQKEKRARFYCIDEKFLENLKNNTINIGSIHKGTSSYIWEIRKKEEVNIFKNYIYESNNFCLQRKKNKLFNIKYRKLNSFTAFNETKSLIDWIKDDRYVLNSTNSIKYRIKKYKDKLSNEEIISKEKI